MELTDAEVDAWLDDYVINTEERRREIAAVLQREEVALIRLYRAMKGCTD